MVKAGRKTLSCPRRQVQNQMEEDDEDIQPQEDTQSPSQPQPEGRAQSPGQPQLQAQASDEASPPDEKQGGETPMETDAQNQEAEEDCPSRSRPPAARALWKPIPQIQPQPAGQWKPIPPLEPQNSPGEPASATSASGSTRNQSCQTEEQPPQSSPGGHAHSLGYCIEPGDPPLFQQPLQTSKSGIQQIIECFRSGTSELKHMLLREVDTIFECKLCRSLFRGLPNLITHKEYYCLRRMPETDGDDRQSVAIRDLLEAIYPRKDRPEHVMRLEPIETSNKAVFQYLSTEDELNRYPAHTASNRQSPVAWDLEEGGSEPQQQQGQQGPSEGPGSSFQSSQSYSQAQRRREAPDEEAPEEAMQAEEDGSTSGVDDVTISCCLCGKDFNSRRSIRRHCRKEHQTKLEELRKFTETRTVPTSLLSLVKGRPRTLTTPTGKSCPVCYKNFATKANVRRHFDEVHRGLRRDTITPEIATRPGQLLTLEATPPKKPAAANPSPTRCTTPKSSTPVSSKGTPQGPNKGSGSGAAAAAPTAPYNLATCRCLLCKRTYSSQVMLKRHMGIVHKMYNLKNGAPVAAATSPSQPPNNGSGAIGEGVRVKQEVEESSDDNDDEEEEEDEEEDTESSSSASASASDRADTPPRKGAATSPGPEAAAPTKGPTKGVKVKTEEQAPPLSPKSSSASSSSSPPPPAPRSAATTTTTTTTTTKAPKLSVGFDFKQLFCKLCKRQFSSRQNLTKHIELHTDGTDIFIKFYRCPLCRYESRRKRDVLRHVTVVHKKSSSYLAKIMPNLESRAVKRSAESVLNNSSLAKKISTAVAAATSSGGGGGGAKKEVNGRNASSSSGPPSPPSPPVTRKQDQQSSSSSSGGATSSGAAPATTTSSSSTSSTSSTAPSSSKAFAPSPPVTRKQERQQQRQRSCSPPLTRRSDKFSSAAAAHARRNEAESGESHSSEVKVTKNFSLHACDQCGRAFAKKLYLESHKRSHRNAAAAATENRRKGINTRSKSLLW